MIKRTGVIFLLLILILSNTILSPAQIDTSAVKAVLVYDSTYNEFIFEKASSVKAYPASITKVMTAILVIENIDDLEKMVTASEYAVSLNRVGGSTTGIKAGEQLSVNHLLEALMIRSGNEVSYILAEAVAGSIPAFVEMMNKKSISIGLTGTNFVNPCGLHEQDHYSTPMDLLKLARYAMRYPLFRQIVSTTHLSLPPTNMHPEEGWADKHNTNLLLTDDRYLSEYFTPYGIKTGSTPFAGYCLISYVKLPYGNELYGIVLGAPNEDSLYNFNKMLYEKISSYYEETILFDTDEIFAYYIHDDNIIPLYSSSPIKVLLPKGFPASKIKVETIAFDDIPLPLDKYTILGSISLSYEDRLIASFDLISKTSYQYTVNVPAESSQNETGIYDPNIIDDDPLLVLSDLGAYLPFVIMLISFCTVLIIIMLSTIRKKTNRSTHRSID